MTDEELVYALRNNVGVSDYSRKAANLAAERIEELVKERDEALNQLDSTRHSVDVLEKRLTDKMAKLAQAVDALRFLEIAATGAGVPHPQERKLLHETICKAREVLAELEKTE